MGDRAFGLDAYIAAVEHGPLRTTTTTDSAVMEAEHRWLAEAGLLDPDQPTPWTHYQYQRALRREFTEEERVRIRVALGMVPDA